MLIVNAWQLKTSGLADLIVRENQKFQEFQSSNTTLIIEEII
jgi:hypothetical protein